MLRIVMPTSFDAHLLERLDDANRTYAERGLRVAEFYGSLPRTPTGSGRPARSLTPVTADAFARHVDEARQIGISFTYAFNTSCTGNHEFDLARRRTFVDALLWARDVGCAAIVVASPYLIDLARRHVPDLRIHQSSIAYLKSTKEARHYLRRGAARLVLDPDTIRDFEFLRKLARDCPGAETEALCNHPCLLNCPYETYCYNCVAHASADDEQATGFEPFSLLSCHMDKLTDPAEFVKGSWIRPQDTHHWEAVGLTAIKIAGRGRSTEWLARVAEAYLAREYDGDLMELIWDPQWAAVWRATGQSAPPRPVRAEAARFDGFIEHFVNNRPDCARGCGACTHCDDFARKALTVDTQALAVCRDRLSTAQARLLEVHGA